MPTGKTDTYIHHLPGRLRVRSQLVKKNQQRALSAAAWLRSLPGVSSADANTVTGSLTLRYDPDLTGGATLLAALREAGYIGATSAHLPAQPSVKSQGSPANFQRELGTRVAKIVAMYAIEEALKAALLALL